jgi:hypothetical protein
MNGWQYRWQRGEYPAKGYPRSNFAGDRVQRQYGFC